MIFHTAISVTLKLGPYIRHCLEQWFREQINEPNLALGLERSVC